MTPKEKRKRAKRNKRRHHRRLTASVPRTLQEKADLAAEELCAEDSIDSIIYRPGGKTSGDAFSNWNDVYNELQSQKATMRTIQIDSRFGKAKTVSKPK